MPDTQYQRNLSLACVVGFGVVVGLQLLYAGFLLLGPKPIAPGQLEAFTRWGRELYRPERDIPLYVSGCAFTIALCLCAVRDQLAGIAGRRHYGGRYEPAG